MDGYPAFEQSPNPNVADPAAEIFDYPQAADEWLDRFFDWREDSPPDEYLAIAKDLQPSRLAFAGPRASVENLMVRSTNNIDEDRAKHLLSQRRMAKDALRVGESFYRRGNYISNREGLFRELSDMGIDDSLPALYKKVAQVINIIPESSLRRAGFSKLCRAIGGVAFLALLEQKDDQLSGLTKSLRAGYDFAVTYPLVDDLVHDSDYLDKLMRDDDGCDFNDTITHLLTTGSTEGVKIPNNSITDELMACFEDGLELFPFAENQALYQTLLALQRAQLADAAKRIGEQYERDDYAPYIQKAALTRVISLLIATDNPRDLPVDKINSIMGLGLRTQLHDDLLDLQDDLSDRNVTPITARMNGHSKEGLNPAELFIDSLFYSLENDFDRAHRQKAARTLLGTAAHAFSILDQETLTGLELSPKYKEVVGFITAKYPPSKIEAKFQAKLDDMAMNRSRLHKNLDVYMLDVQERVNTKIEGLIASSGSVFYDIYRHVFDGSAKRIRPALAYITGDTFGIDRGKLDEYSLAGEILHTASLIFDDLPAQDNSSLRRGKEAVHLRFGEGISQIAALSMIFDAQERIAGIDSDFSLEGRLSKYINRSLGKEGLCLGQTKDLQTFRDEAPEDVTAEDLDQIAYLKTGLAIEMSTVGAALIGRISDEQINCIKEYSYHFGIVFQVKDDLLDSLPSTSSPAKTPDLDSANHKPNYVSVLGIEAAEAKLRYHNKMAVEAINRLSPNINTVKFRQIIKHVVER